MRHLLTWPLLLCLFSAKISAQAPEEPRPPQWVALVGAGFEWFDSELRVNYLSVEKTVGPYWHIGVQATIFGILEDRYSYYINTTKRNWEYGVYGKYFLSGKMSGRKSAVFIGPDVRVGRKVIEVPEPIVFPTPPSVNYLDINLNSRTFLVRMGFQWRMKFATFEFASPIGMKFERSSNIPVYMLDNRDFVMYPTASLGVSF